MPWSSASCADRYLAAAAETPTLPRQSSRPTTNTRTICSNIRIADHFRFAALMSNRALVGRPDQVGVLAQRAALVGISRGLPILLALRELGFADFQVERAGRRVDRNDVAVLEQADRAADGRFRADVTDAESTRAAREATVGDERDLL